MHANHTVTSYELSAILPSTEPTLKEYQTRSCLYPHSLDWLHGDQWWCVQDFRARSKDLLERFEMCLVGV